MSTRSFRGVRIIRFGDFELDLRAAELRKHGIRVRLQEQPFRILALLLERPGEVVLREEIRRRLWPNDTIVEVGHGINAAVLRLREALGESAEKPRYIETLARRGYRFTGHLEMDQRTVKAPEPAALDLVELPGQTLSHFRVLNRLGVGGMGVVFRAEDLHLGRQVALKFLPSELSRDATALSRFRQEARAASLLNHPHICTIYEVEECSGQPVIVMELLEGETLEARLARCPVALEEALPLAIQMAGALQAAHAKGVIHRDFKPANVVVTSAGVKVLDFGLAKTPRLAGTDLSVTREGTIIGTLHYMSPEQVQGKDADACSDIFSFGLVLYEMLTGGRAHTGENSARVMAAILTAEPPELKRCGALEPVVRRCLAKDPHERWQSASDLKAALEWFAEGWKPAPTPAPTPRPARRIHWKWAPAGAIAAAAGGLFLAVNMLHLPGSPTSRFDSMKPEPAQPVRINVTSPDNAAIVNMGLSPDGRSLAYVSGAHIWVRPVDSSEARQLDVADKVGTPFWSLDSRSLAFADGGRLMTVPVGGGSPTWLADVETNLTGTWGRDGSILIGKIGDGIFRCSGRGEVSRVTTVDPLKNETRHMVPQYLPGGRRFLFVAGSNQPNDSMLYAASLDSNERKAIMPIGSNFAFVQPSGEPTGYLIFLREQVLMAQPFDPVKVAVAGSAVSVSGAVTSQPALGTAIQIARFAAAGDTLAYRPLQSSMGNATMPRGDNGITVIRNWQAALRR